MKIRYIFTSRKQIRKWDNDRDTIAYSLYNPKANEYQILLPYRVSVRTRLHELAHVFLGHLDNLPKYTDEIIRYEIQAEIWANEKCGKRVSLDAMLNIAAYALQWGDRTNFIFNQILNTLNDKGQALDKCRRSNLWHGIRELERIERK